MSNHFTYEIDERNIRIQLKDFALPVKEEDWRKFEEFSESQHNQTRENRLKSFNVNLNRNVVLPIAFGLIIILFSFLLVNFISIKSPKNTVNQKAQMQTGVTPDSKLTENKPVSLPAKQVSIPKVEDKSQDLAAISEIKKEEISAPISTTTQDQNLKTVAVTPSNMSTEVNTDNIVHTNASQETPVKKRSKRRSAEVIEAEQLQEIRPTVVSEERDIEEVRPD